MLNVAQGFYIANHGDTRFVLKVLYQTQVNIGLYCIKVFDQLRRVKGILWEQITFCFNILPQENVAVFLKTQPPNKNAKMLFCVVT